MKRIALVVLTAGLATLACVESHLGLDGPSGQPGQPGLVSEDDPVHLVGGDRPRGLYRVIARDDAPSGDEQSFGALTAAPRRTIFLNRRGGTYTPGNDDSSRNVSSIPSTTSTVPAYEKGDASWAQVVACVKDQYARFNVEVTDVDPGGVPHVEAVIGGVPRNIGMQDGVGGVAPMFQDCSMVETAVVYIFSRVFSSAQVECEVAAQEISHAIGLDHEYLCEDPMTYLNGCGKKTFQNKEVSCGEYSPRTCMCGGRQNSVQFMLTRLGAAPALPLSSTGGTGVAGRGGSGGAGAGGMGGAAPPPPGGGGTGGSAPPPTGDTTPPQVAITSPAEGATLPANSRVTITATASDNVGVTRVELFWQFNGRALPCDGSVPNVTCTQTGSTYAWSFAVGKGSRPFEVRAYDAAGLRGTSGVRTIFFSDGSAPPTGGTGGTAPPPGGAGAGGSAPPPPGGAGAGGSGNPPPPPPPPPTANDPRLTITAPVSGAQVRPGDVADLRVGTAAPAGGRVVRVDVLWQAPTDARLFQMTALSDGVWGLRVQLGATAQAGVRAITATALTDTGYTASASVMVQVGAGGNGTDPPIVPSSPGG